MTRDSMYAGRAELYDRIYAFKDYAAEAARVREILHDLGIPDGARVLDAGCGTGSHLAGLRERFDAEGFDLHEELLEVARRKLPGVRVWQADFRSFAAPRPFDAIVCLFSAIGYLLDESSLRAAAGAFARAVRPGGVVLVEPWFTVEEWRTGAPSLQTANEDPDCLVARACVAGRDGERSILDFHWLVARRGAPAAEHFSERHELWLCPRPTLARAFADAGFEVRFDQPGVSGRGLLVGRKTR